MKTSKSRTDASRPVHKICSQQQVQNIIQTVRLQNGELVDYRKIFCIGFNKTGTTSMHALFESLGFQAMDGPHWRKAEHWHVHYQFQTFTDGPPYNFKDLDKKFPKSLFILNVRNLDEWLDSRIEHIKFRMASGSFKPRRNWSLSHRSICEWILKRQAHHLNVLRYFSNRPESFLVINYIKNNRAADIICNFIGKPVVDIKPYVRSTPKLRGTNQVKNQQLLDPCFEELGLKSNEASNDLLCPSLMKLDLNSRFPLDSLNISYDHYL